MSQTNGRWEATQPFTDAFIPFAANDVNATSGTAALTRNAKGDYSLNVSTGQTCIFMMPFSTLIHRLGTAFLDTDSLEEFGGANSPYNSQLRPPITNASNPIGGGTPTTGVMTNRGLKIVDIVLHYFIGAVNLSTHTIGLSKTVYPAAAGALVVTDVLANAANGLPVAFNANPQSTKVTIASPIWNMSDLSALMFEIDATTSTGTYRLYGGSVHVQYNLA